MKKNRRDFMKRTGLAGLSVPSASLLLSCNQSKDAETSASTVNKPADINDKVWPMAPNGKRRNTAVEAQTLQVATADPWIRCF